MKVDNAIIMAAGTSSRFAPLSFEKHKAMTVVKGEVLIERQIRQLRSAGVPEIYIVTGYKAEQFDHLVPEYGVKLIPNHEYLTRNNNGSIMAVKDFLANSYICSSDNYFNINPFENEVDDSYYAAEFAQGQTNEWCMTEDKDGYIDSVTIGGGNAWYMMGHAFWSEGFSERFIKILEDEYDLPGTAGKLWEKIFMAHLDELKMKIRKYGENEIFEFDTLDELRKFDPSYVNDSGSSLMKSAAYELGIKECDMTNIREVKGDNAAATGFSFDAPGGHYVYMYDTGKLMPDNS